MWKHSMEHHVREVNGGVEGARGGGTVTFRGSFPVPYQKEEAVPNVFKAEPRLLRQRVQDNGASETVKL